MREARAAFPGLIDAVEFDRGLAVIYAAGTAPEYDEAGLDCCAPQEEVRTRGLTLGAWALPRTVAPHHVHEAAFEPEDALALDHPLARKPGARLRVAVPVLPAIANFDDFDPLVAEPEVEVIRIRPGQALPGDAQLVILPGSKSTLADLAALRAAGFDVDIVAHLRRGGHVLGLCGGYQMLGNWLESIGLAGAAERAKSLSPMVNL
jgi:hypothetical protein